MMANELQKRAVRHAAEYDSISGRKPPDIPAATIHLTEELGELCAEIYNGLSGRKESDVDNIKDAIADIFIQLSVLAEKYGVDIEKEVLGVVERDMKDLKKMK